MAELEDQESETDQGQAGEEEFQKRAHGASRAGGWKFGLNWTFNNKAQAEFLPALCRLKSTHG